MDKLCKIMACISWPVDHGCPSTEILRSILASTKYCTLDFEVQLASNICFLPVEPVLWSQRHSARCLTYQGGRENIPLPAKGLHTCVQPEIAISNIVAARGITWVVRIDHHYSSTFHVHASWRLNAVMELMVQIRVHRLEMPCKRVNSDKKNWV